MNMDNQINILFFYYYFSQFIFTNYHRNRSATKQTTQKRQKTIYEHFLN